MLVFFLSRLTGDPTNLCLPLDASLRARAEFAEKHGFNDPLTEQFGAFSKASCGSIGTYEGVWPRTAFDRTGGCAIV